jgi:hypothetical protein
MAVSTVSGNVFEVKYGAVCVTLLSTNECLCPWRRRGARTEVNALKAVIITNMCHRNIAVRELLALVSCREGLLGGGRA